MGAIETDSVCLTCCVRASTDDRPSPSTVDLTAALAAEADVRLRIYPSPSQSHPSPAAGSRSRRDDSRGDDMGGPRDEMPGA
jgi:hypothetical protein